MSGGSFDYLHNHSCIPEELVERIGDVEKMKDVLKDLPAAEEAFMTTLKIVEAIHRLRSLVDEHGAEIGTVWYAVEWWKSGDRSEDSAIAAAARYAHARKQRERTL